MWKKLFSLLLLMASAFLVGVAIYDRTIITGFAAKIATYFKTNVPTFVNSVSKNPLPTLAAVGGTVTGVITVGRWISGIKQKAVAATQEANQKIDISNKTIENSVKQVESLKTEYQTKTEQQLADLKESQGLTTKLQIENDRLKRENEQLKTEYSVLQTEHESLKERVQLKKVIE